MIVGGYSLHLYCSRTNPEHGFDEFPHQFTGETGQKCRAKARICGWKLDMRSLTAVCPKCARKAAKRAAQAKEGAE